MKRIFTLSMSLLLIASFPAFSQVGGLLKKVKNSVVNEISDKVGGNSNTAPRVEPEPDCECDSVEVILNMGGKIQLDYRELDISMLDDGRLLARDRASNQYYVVKNGVTEGPYKPEDPQVEAFTSRFDADNDISSLMRKYPTNISRQGEKYLITFKGKSYGPFAEINKFTLSASKDKFAAMVIETHIVSKKQEESLEEAMEKARSDEERLQIAMEYSALVNENLEKGGGINSLNPKVVSNIPGATYDYVKWQGSELYGSVKYDNIVVIAGGKVIDLTGKTIITINTGNSGYNNSEQIFVSSNNLRYVAFSYGTLKFNDGAVLSGLIYPHLTKSGAVVYLSYMYYSPKRNAIVQCKIPF